MAVLRSKRAFTLIELLVVVAIIALLISILLPSLQQARAQGKKAVSMSNFRSIAQASHSYATDDDREMIIPMHQTHALDWTGVGMGNTWGWRTGQPYAYGGRTPIKSFPSESGLLHAMRAKDEGGTGYWEAHTRPLNKYVYGDVDQSDAKRLEMYHSPADVGYPDAPEWIRDAPRQCADIPVYDIVGNSYRINTAGLLWTGGPSGDLAHFNVSAQAHQASAIVNPSRVVLYCEPLFYNFSRQDPAWNPEISPIVGWHGKLLSDLATFCDGSARLTRVDELAQFDLESLRAMNFSTAFGTSNWYYFLRRGKTWQTDCYPAAGAHTAKFDRRGVAAMPAPPVNWTGWPFDGYLANQPPG